MRRGKVALSWRVTNDFKRICVVVPVLLFSDLRLALCSHSLQARRLVIRSTWQRFTCTNVSVAEAVQLLYQISKTLIELASSGWHHLMAFYFQVTSLQWKNTTFLFPDGIQVEETEQMILNKTNEMRSSAEQKIGEKHLNLQREELCCSGWSHRLCQSLLCSRLREHIESESHFPEEFIVWKDKANRENWWPGLSWPVPEVQHCNLICCVIQRLLGSDEEQDGGWYWAHQLTALNRLTET